MMSRKLILSALMINLLFFASCGQKDDSKNLAENIVWTEQPQESNFKTIHSYGGWYCPDNVIGFPAVDVQEFDKVPVVNGRLPTKEETKTGVSLMYFDTALIPSARPLDMTMPKLARFYSENTEKNELVIVIQAVEVEKDTVVGFRYLNGGNGSAWFGEVDFISDGEISKLGPTPFVMTNAEINAASEKVWEIITSPTYAKTLGKIFDKNAFVESDWEKGSKVHFKYEPDRIVSTGTITASWENLYIQVDYDFDGYHYVEKFLLLQDENTNSTQFHIVAGPYGKDFEAQKVVWNYWLQKVKELSEGK